LPEWLFTGTPHTSLRMATFDHVAVTAIARINARNMKTVMSFEDISASAKKGGGGAGQGEGARSFRARSTRGATHADTFAARKHAHV